MAGKESNRDRQRYGRTGPAEFRVYIDAIKWMPELAKHNGNGLFGPLWTPKAKSLGIAVATLVSKDASRTDWKYYILDETVGDAVLRAFARQATCKISFVDAEAQPVLVERFDPRWHTIGHRAL